MRYCWQGGAIPDRGFGAGLHEPINGEKQQRRPDERTQVWQMAGIDVQEMRAAKHEDYGRQKTSYGMQPPASSPATREPARQKDVQNNCPVDRCAQRQNQE